MFTRHESGVGYGWFVRSRFNRRIVAMNGRSPGFTSSIERCPDGEWVVIVLSNSYASVSQSIASDLAAIALGEPTSARASRAAAVIPSVLQRHVGRYRLPADYYVPGAVATIDAAADHLVWSYPGVEGAPLVPQADGTFIDRLFWGSVRFEEGAGGRSERFVLSMGREFVAPRIPEGRRP